MVSIVTSTDVTKAVLAKKEKMMGVVSTEPGLVLGSDLGGPGSVPVALAGRVLIKVSTENGTISSGDYLSLSSIPGVATKATKAGVVVGQALEGYSGSTVGKIAVFVKNSYYSGLSSDKLPGLVSSGSLPTSEEILAALMNGTQTTSGAVSEIYTDRIISTVEVVTPKLVAGLVKATDIQSPVLDAIKARLDALESHFASSTSSMIGAALEWTGEKITATLGIFNRVETNTARVSKGLELIDQADQSVYCITIRNGEIEKTAGSCDAETTASSSGASSTDTIEAPVTQPDSTSTTDVTAPEVDSTTQPAT
jgi:hypothetical protein